ncbi:hypothetical protein B0H14DRAFT_3554788 [Mycena olivaceomarginata]|nr:hypothetical protein B0H14DRAFT_3554788 [Mycena olivaceomarginata]
MYKLRFEPLTSAVVPKFGIHPSPSGKPASSPAARRHHPRRTRSAAGCTSSSVRRSFTTAESSTDDEFELGSEGEGDNAQSPPTSFEGGYEDEEAAETVSHHEEDAREEEDEDEDSDGGEEDYHDTPAPHPWYKPSVPVLLALAPPIGNWLTGGDHVKDLLLLLLLVFYLHQIVEGSPLVLLPRRPPPRPPARVTPTPTPAHIPALRARPRRPRPVRPPHPRARLLFLCLITPFLGVALLRSLASLSSPSSSSGAKPAAPRPDLLVLHRPLRPRDPPSARCASSSRASSRAQARSTLKSTRTLRVLPCPETSTTTRSRRRRSSPPSRAQVARLELAVCAAGRARRAGNRAVYGHGRGQHGRAKTRPSYYGPGGDRVLLHAHKKTVDVNRTRSTRLAPVSCPCRMRKSDELHGTAPVTALRPTRPTGRTRCNAYVEDALAPLEKGVRRVERACRAGCARGARSSRGRPSPIRSRPQARVPVRVKAGRYSSPLSRNFRTRRRSRSSARGSGGSPAQPPPPPHTTYVPPPLSPTNGSGSGAGKRRALDSIPEEDGVDVPLHVLPHPRHTHPAYIPAHVHAPDVGAGGTLLSLLRAWLAACVALALYPLYVVLKPVRGVARVVGVGLGAGR